MGAFAEAYAHSTYTPVGLLKVMLSTAYRTLSGRHRYTWEWSPASHHSFSMIPGISFGFLLTQILYWQFERYNTSSAFYSVIFESNTFLRLMR